MSDVYPDQRETKDAGEPIFEILTLTMLTGDKVDLTPWLVQLNIYEDMFSPTLTGNITILDPINLFERFGLSGNEKLTVKIFTASYGESINDPMNIIHRTFDINKITDIKSVNDYSKQYTLHFASPELRKNELIKISSWYKDSENSKIVADIFSGQYDLDGISDDTPTGLGFPTESGHKSIPPTSPYLLGDMVECWWKKEDADDTVELFVEKTKYIEPIRSFPYMRPFDIIQQLAGVSIRKAGGRHGGTGDSEAANFVFFENKRGFQWISIDSLLENKDISTTHFRYGSAEQNFAVKNNRVVFTEVIENLQIQNSFDILHNIRNGMYASKLYSYDLATGEIMETNYNYLEDFYKTERTESENDYPPVHLSPDNEDLSRLTDNYLSKRMFTIHSPSFGLDNITSEESFRQNEQNPYGTAEYLQKRMSQLARWSNFQVIFEIAGNTKHKVGDCVDIDLSEMHQDENVDFKSVPSKYYSGNYLLTSIKHSITKLDYKMTIEAAKDSHKARYGSNI